MKEKSCPAFSAVLVNIEMNMKQLIECLEFKKKVSVTYLANGTLEMSIFDNLTFKTKQKNHGSFLDVIFIEFILYMD